MATPLSITDNYDALLSTTLKKYRRQLAIQIFSHIPFFWWMFTKGRKETQDGGESLIVPLMYGENDTVASYDGYDTLDLTPQEGISAAQFQWKSVAGSVVISLTDKRKNSGKSAIISLLKAKIQQLEISFRNQLAVMAMGDGSGNGGKDILGLKAIVEEGTSWGTLGGINRTTYSWWRNIHKDTVGAYSTNLLPKMSNLYNTLTEGMDHIDLVLASQQAFEWYEAKLQASQRFTSPETGKAGFDTLKFKGATMFFDNNVDQQGSAEVMYFLNSQYLKVIVDSMLDFMQTPFMDAYNQMAQAAKLLWMGNIVVSNCRKQGFFSDITAT